MTAKNSGLSLLAALLGGCAHTTPVLEGSSLQHGRATRSTEPAIQHGTATSSAESAVQRETATDPLEPAVQRETATEPLEPAIQHGTATDPKAYSLGGRSYMDLPIVRFRRSGHSYRLAAQLRLDPAIISNPSGLTYGGESEAGGPILYTVCDGSAVVRDHFSPWRTLARVHLTPDLQLAEVEAVSLAAEWRACDLEAIDVDPRDQHLWIADERVAGLEICGGRPGGYALATLSKLSREGRMLVGPFNTDIRNTDNNGIEALAVRQEGDGVHLYAFEERRADRPPWIYDYQVGPGDVPHLARILSLDRPQDATQTGADFTLDGRLLLSDRQKIQLLSIDLLGCLESSAHPSIDKPTMIPEACVDTADLRPLTIEALELVTPGSHRGRIGLVEGLTTDPQGRIYLVLDNNGRAYRDGDRSPRLLVLEPLTEGIPDH